MQLANEAASLCTREDAVQIVAIGCSPQPAALLGASVICCTAAEFMALGVRGGSTMSGSSKDSAFQGVIEAVLADVRVLVLDELDSLLPVYSVYAGNKQRAGEKKKAENKKYDEAAAQVLLRAAIEMCAAPELQLLAASATVSRPYRAKLARVLRRDPLGRWYERQPDIVRPYALAEADLTDRPNAIVVPGCVRHMYLPLPAGVKLRRAVPITAAKRAAARRKGGPTLKEKRARKAKEARVAAGAYDEDADFHPLLVSLEAAFRHTQPSSALVFICRSSGLTVRRATRELGTLGLPALALHEAIGLEHASPPEEEASAAPSLRGSGGGIAEGGGDGVDEGAAEAAEEGVVWRDPSAALLGRHSSVSAAFASRLRPAEADAEGAADAAAVEAAAEGAAGVGEEEEEEKEEEAEEAAAAAAAAPMLVTFEDMARGLHFAGVSHVFILGMPDSPATYLHLAGRCGRHGGTDGGVVDGTVTTPLEAMVEVRVRVRVGVRFRVRVGIRVS